MRFNAWWIVPERVRTRAKLSSFFLSHLDFLYWSPNPRARLRAYISTHSSRYAHPSCVHYIVINADNNLPRSSHRTARSLVRSLSARGQISHFQPAIKYRSKTAARQSHARLLVALIFILISVGVFARIIFGRVRKKTYIRSQYRYAWKVLVSYEMMPSLSRTRARSIEEKYLSSLSKPVAGNSGPRRPFSRAGENDRSAVSMSRLDYITGRRCPTSAGLKSTFVPSIRLLRTSPSP